MIDDDHHCLTITKNNNNQESHPQNNDLESSSTSSTTLGVECGGGLSDCDESLIPIIVGADELPIFTIRSISPNGGSISSIDSSPEDQDDDADDDDFSYSGSGSISPSSPSEMNVSPENPILQAISLEEINAQIGTPPKTSRYSRYVNLETIFEDKFLETPPKKFKTDYSYLNDDEDARDGDDDAPRFQYTSNNCLEEQFLLNFLENIEITDN